MRRLHLKFIYALIFLLTIITSQNKAFSQNWLKTIKVSAMSESISLPFTQVNLLPVYHPGISIGADLHVKDQTSWYKSFGVEAGYYYHELYEHAFMLDAVYNFGYTFNFKLRTNFIGMLGYKHSVLTGDTFVLEDGEYKEKKHLGQPQINTKIGFGVEYPINDKLSITSDYLGMIAIPYSPGTGKPFASHTLIRLGFKIKLQ